jgi:ATP/maltotriose-dependent transcriptional regulator MalT
VAHRARGHAFDTAAAHLVQALGLACAQHLPRIAIESQFELGNVRAQQGDLASALAGFRAVVELAQQVGDHVFEVEGHNNVAYHALLLGDLAAAHAHIAAGLELAERYELELPRQWLYSTRGEIALAEEQWAEAERWLSRALAAAEQYQNTEQIAISYANLAAAARGSGASDEAVLLLERAGTVAASAALPYVQTQIDLWQAELYLARKERASAGEAVQRAYTRMQGRDYGRLAAWAERLAQEVRGNAADRAASNQHVSRLESGNDSSIQPP